MFNGCWTYLVGVVLIWVGQENIVRDKFGRIQTLRNPRVPDVLGILELSWRAGNVWNTCEAPVAINQDKRCDW